MGRRGLYALVLALASMLHVLIPACHGNNSVRLMLIEELRTAPADRDVLAHVPKAQRHLWEHHDGRSINETLQSFTAIPVDITVAIKLIGFDGDGINNVKVKEADFLRYLHGLHLDMHTPALEPELRNLAIQPRLHFQISKAPTALTHKLAGALTSASFAARTGKGANVVTYVPHTVVDDILAAEEREQAAAGSPGHGSTPSFTLYFLNLEPPSNTDYLYTYREDPNLVAAGNWSEFGSCPGLLYASDQTTSGAGFAWVDMGAAPYSYGPLRGNQGQVFPHSLPHAANYQPNVASLAILPDLAATAASAIRHLVWPPLQHAKLALPRPSGASSLVVQVVHIHDTLAIPPQSLQRLVIQKELERALSGSAMTVEVRESFLSFAMCDLCVNAYTNALRVRTQRREGSAVVATSGQILDRLALHQTLSQYSDIILAYAGVHETHDTLPVFLFDLSMKDEALLLDGALQAAAFPDMVVAVATRANSAHTRFSCGYATRHIKPSEVTREVLGGILQSAFGVAHIALRYHPASGTGWDYLWAIGATPFGPLSDMMSISGATASTVRRNLAVVELDRQAGRIAAVLQGMSRLSPKGQWNRAVPSTDTRNRLHARINVAAIKMELAVMALSQGRNSDALRMARLLSHDASAMERLALHVESALLAKMNCQGVTDWTVLLWPPAGSLLAVALAVWWRSRGARLRAEARYDKIY
ncbi:hypothetical protein Vretimale_16242 [Volvox reticuliferus]|uniref:DUF7906 domain-containing protein n=1 Tax=Volvox reticuliferus TaxID=1737510 RepID=A0A8J4CUN3_9CHLO|nr:hypothetical protein Vretifemale_16865 [Volvox reticuliferus]GIM13089.1 hypothetical protein Vretimale_16242 [Volvox reticuliferus]